MKNTDDGKAGEQIPGPFEVSPELTNPPRVATSAGRFRRITPESVDGTNPERRIDCKNYEECLNLAAALNWDSFTCTNCNGAVNESLRWRAGQSTRRDALAKAICGRGTMSGLKTSTECGATSKSDDNEPPR